MSNLKVAEFPKSDQADIDVQVMLIEKVLAEARAGNLETLMIVAMDRRSHTLVKWSGTEDLMLLASHLARMQHVTQRRLDGDFDE
jgi:hypothetical protein